MTGESAAKEPANEGHGPHAIRRLNAAQEELSKIVVGQKEVIHRLFTALACGGNVLVEGVPGIAKTLILRAMAQVSGCEFKRIQFTPDLLPTDITGLSSYSKKKGYEIVKGPIFANFVLADEINRAPPRVQSALLEAMQERQVTLGRHAVALPKPFFVMATQNPIEQTGTYPLPNVQLDRFLFKLLISYPLFEEEKTVMARNITSARFEEFKLKHVLSPEKILSMQKQVAEMDASDAVKEAIVTIVDATRNPKQYGVRHGKFIKWGVSPRASISLYHAAKASALLRGAKEPSVHDVKDVAFDCLRHRLVLNYDAQAENLKNEEVIKDLLALVN
ncbi:MoxR family ATPase [Candidatus Micrarchaeota archaeon]|nr:MoxR family ATPase [Candidatus Micrarchaeota archaeon]